jgi:hypothetical protein
VVVECIPRSTTRCLPDKGREVAMTRKYHPERDTILWDPGPVAVEDTPEVQVWAADRLIRLEDLATAIFSRTKFP